MYFHDRDEHGHLKFPKKKRFVPPTYREVFYREWRRYGLREDLIDKLWTERNG